MHARACVGHPLPAADVAAGFSKFCWHYNYNMQATAHYMLGAHAIRVKRLKSLKDCHSASHRD